MHLGNGHQLLSAARSAISWAEIALSAHQYALSPAATDHRASGQTYAAKCFILVPKARAKPLLGNARRMTRLALFFSLWRCGASRLITDIPVSRRHNGAEESAARNSKTR